MKFQDNNYMKFEFNSLNNEKEQAQPGSFYLTKIAGHSEWYTALLVP